MGYSIKEFWHDVKETNAKYDAGIIDFDQRAIQLQGYLSILDKIDKRTADSVRKTMGL